MKEIKPPNEIAELLQTFDAMGGVIQFVLVACEEAPSDFTQYKQAAIFALSVIEEREREYFAGLRQQYPGNSETYRDQLFERSTHIYACDVERLQGMQINLKDFLGPYFDPRKGEFITERCFALDAEKERTNIAAQVQDTESYRYAFADTPYGASATSGMRVSKVFLSLNDYFFNGFAAPLDIYKWSTDWHEHFDAGHEWWGSFLWTVYNPQQQFIVVIAASATD